MSKVRVPIDIITCPDWHARPPKSDITIIGKAPGFVLHHTAGHVRQLGDPSITTKPEAMQYAHDIQNMHMAPGGLGVPNGGIDSGHNFMVVRAGFILQGRWQTVSAIQAGRMVQSAHASSPDGNRRIGIEVEHNGHEEMTTKQFESVARLMAWCCGQYQRTTIMPMAPHSAFFRTECPANLKDDIAALKARALAILRAAASA